METDMLPLIKRSIGSVLTVASICVALYFGLRPSPQKSLELQYHAKLSLITDEVGSLPQYKVLYGDRVVSNLTKLSATLINTGDIPITPSDVEEPPSLTAPSGSILEARIVRSQPPNILASCLVEGNKVTIEHGLLNPGDLLTFELVLDTDPGWMRPNARITGVTSVSVSTLRIPGESFQAIRK